MKRKTEETPVKGSKLCPHCRRRKPLGAFAPRRSRAPGAVYSWCRACVRVGVGEYQQSDRYREWLRAYLDKPDVRERRREADRRRQEKRRGKPRACNRTPRGKLLHCRRQARIRLRAATDPARVSALEALIAQYAREIERIDRQMNAGLTTDRRRP